MGYLARDDEKYKRILFLFSVRLGHDESLEAFGIASHVRQIFCLYWAWNGMERASVLCYLYSFFTVPRKCMQYTISQSGCKEHEFNLSVSWAQMHTSYVDILRSYYVQTYHTAYIHIHILHNTYIIHTHKNTHAYIHTYILKTHTHTSGEF